uniref:Centrosomal protein of 63 kDa n=1 Tax=Papio anubis TaxID=9555 RepID=A0A8I5MZX3_PAPAN
MKQIDIMVAHKKSEWEGRTHALETCLKIREQELKTLRGQLDVTHKEVGMLHQQVEEHEKIKQEMTMEYKQELKKLHEELGILKRSYEKLQKKQMREFRGNTKNHREDRSEIERLTAKIEEFRQKSLDWEKQRLIYQQQVSSLEAQRKALAEQSEIIQAQLANRKQKLESVELSSQSEIQHLSSKLERANDTICANELEIERLTMRVNDLVGTSMTVLQEQQQKEEKLRESEKLLEALQEEKRELRAALQSQENLIHEGRMQKEQLQEKVKAADTQHAVEAISLESVSATCKQLSQELMEKYEELKRMEAHNNEYRAEIKKLKEQILQGEQSYSSALEGMKMEISHLTQELHQRDISIASTKGSSSDMEKRLKAEIQKAEEKAVEHKEILDQLESLKLENRHLSEMVMKFELGLHELESGSVTQAAAILAHCKLCLPGSSNSCASASPSSWDYRALCRTSWDVTSEASSPTGEGGVSYSEREAALPGDTQLASGRSSSGCSCPDAPLCCTSSFVNQDFVLVYTLIGGTESEMKRWFALVT